MFLTLKGTARHLFAIVVILVLWSAMLLEVSRDPPCFIDEPAWITAGYTTFELFSARASSTEWESAYSRLSLRDWGNKNPPVGKLLIGIAVAFAKVGDQPVDYKWQWGLNLSENARRGNLPPRQLLRAGRLAIVFAAGALLALLYVAAFQLTGRPCVALVAPALVFMTPAFQFHAVRVMTDIPMLALAAAGLVCYLRFVRCDCWKSFLVALVFLGLAVATKFSAAVYLLGIALHLVIGRWSWKHKALACIAAAALPLLVFVAVNPFLYPDPVGRSIQLTRDWSASKQVQQRDPVLARRAITQPLWGLGLTAVRSTVMPSFTPPFRSRVATRLERHLPILALLGSATCVLMLGLGYRLRPTRRPWGYVVDVGMVIIGAGAGGLLLEKTTVFAPLFMLGVLGVGRAWLGEDRLQRPARDALGAAGVVWLIAWLLTGLWLPFDWARYYLPVILPAALLAAVGAKTVADGWCLCRAQPRFLAAWKFVTYTLAGAAAVLLIMIGTVLVVVITGPLA